MPAGESSTDVDRLFVTRMLPFAVDDRTARRLDTHRADLVGLRARGVLRAGEHLQRPEPHEQRREADHDQRAEDRDAPRELRRQPIGLDPVCSASGCSDGVGLDGSGAGGRVVVLAKELHLRRQLVPTGRPQQPPHERVDRRGEDEVQDDRRESGCARPLPPARSRRARSGRRAARAGRGRSRPRRRGTAHARGRGRSSPRSGRSSSPRASARAT